ncbi:membrane protein DedA with SNARE-associated domain [Scopulibacillus darangshiensis]|uniref:Membrane protein DedA with SNARE-associated domain n=1 Tax=Scopulibacillus darangshiensis TaxID=442528 RepID=A0A4R2NTX2_9BACL|nr:DedA family protein [Scopulibacillus darangshiensis]TCP24835.1 membrane protein DedA with SNARE-associated domain [Scopulibacillus darangshiensis]
MHQLVEWFGSLATALISEMGHWGIFIGMILESACIPLPSEAIMPFGGFMAAQGTLNFWLVILAGIFGNLVGSSIAFWIGRKGGYAFLQKYGHYVWLNEHHLKKAEYWFEKFGGWAVFLGRDLPIIRTFISLPAGIAHMNFKRFMLFTLFGCIPWNILLTYVGWKLGDHWQEARPYLQPLSYIALILILLWGGQLIYKNVLRKQKG